MGDSIELLKLIPRKGMLSHNEFLEFIRKNPAELWKLYSEAYEKAGMLEYLDDIAKYFVYK